jgi:hypothetical protein
MCGACVIMPDSGVKSKDLFNLPLLIALVTCYTRLFLRFNFAFCHCQRTLEHLCYAKQATLEAKRDYVYLASHYTTSSLQIRAT